MNEETVKTVYTGCDEYLDSECADEKDVSSMWKRWWASFGKTKTAERNA